MYLSRLCLNQTRIGVTWSDNPYRVHQRLMMACEGDPRLLFRIEDAGGATQIIVQSHVEPRWTEAFSDLKVLAGAPEQKVFNPRLGANRQYRFRLLANPTVKKETDTGKATRLGLVRAEDQGIWFERKLSAIGASPQGYVTSPRGLQYSTKGAQTGGDRQTHLAVMFEGVLLVNDPAKLIVAVEAGIGSAKGFGFGLLSLAPA